MITSCASKDYSRTTSAVDLERFMGKWYVIAGRLTFMEKGAHNAVEVYRWNSQEKRIDVDFTFRKDAFTGPLKSIPQKAWIENTHTNAHWKVSPFWPLKFNYLVLDLAPDYAWTVIGVPGQEWVWIMARDWQMDEPTLAMIIQRLKNSGYNTKDIQRVPQRW